MWNSWMVAVPGGFHMTVKESFSTPSCESGATLKVAESTKPEKRNKTASFRLELAGPTKVDDFQFASVRVSITKQHVVNRRTRTGKTHANVNH
jgi:hypothetical protein